MVDRLAGNFDRLLKAEPIILEEENIKILV